MILQRQMAFEQRETVQICLPVPFLSYVCRPNIHKLLIMQCSLNRFSGLLIPDCTLYCDISTLILLGTVCFTIFLLLIYVYLFIYLISLLYNCFSYYFMMIMNKVVLCSTVLMNNNVVLCHTVLMNNKVVLCHIVPMNNKVV